MKELWQNIVVGVGSDRVQIDNAPFTPARALLRTISISPVRGSHLRSPLVNLGVVFGSFFCVLVLLGQNPAISSLTEIHQSQSFTGMDVQAGDWFGRSTAGNADRIVVGAHGQNQYQGAAYLFARQGSVWTQQQKLLPNSADKMNFGVSVGMSTDWTVVGAPGASFIGNVVGYANVYDNMGGVSTLTPSNGHLVDRFGTSVAVDGDLIAVGAPGADRPGLQSGSAYLFERQGANWVQSIELLPTGTVAGSSFGQSIDVSGTRVIVGATDYSGGYKGGQAFIFEKLSGQWQQTCDLTLIAPGYHDAFGNSVAIDGNYAVVGSPGNRGNQADHPSGAVYVYERGATQWTFKQALVPFAGDSVPAQFGYSVDICGDKLLVGAVADAAGGTTTGMGYVFQLSGGVWSPFASLSTLGPLYKQFLGSSAYIGDSFCALGAPSLSTVNPSVGYVQIFMVPEPSSVVLMVVGAGGLLLARIRGQRKRRRSSA